jgi:tripartite-type tricarboxylate transporter receptor subunit TctC
MQRVATHRAALALLILAASVSMQHANAQGYPEKPLRIVLGFPPGGAVDFVARLVGQKLTESLKQPTVIENRPGAATSISAERVARAPADGYTLLLLPISTAVQSAVRTNLPYDLKRDIAPIAQVSVGPLIIVAHPSLPAKNLKELVALARAQPGRLEWSSPGIGSANHIAGELLAVKTHCRWLHVPFKGGSEAVVAEPGQCNAYAHEQTAQADRGIDRDARYGASRRAHHSRIRCARVRLFDVVWVGCARGHA